MPTRLEFAVRLAESALLDELMQGVMFATVAGFANASVGKTLGLPPCTRRQCRDRIDHEAELFARRIAGRLAGARAKGRFERLCIAAAPRFLGRLHKPLDPQVAKTVVDEVDKDLLQLNRREVTQQLFKT
jgi:hypothetical protein